MGLCSYYFAFMVCTCRRIFYEQFLFNPFETSWDTINCFAIQCTKTRLMIYDRIFIDIYLAHAIRGCKYDRVYFDIFYLHLWTDISQRELKMGPCHQYIYSHWRDHTHCPGKKINIKIVYSLFRDFIFYLFSSYSIIFWTYSQWCFNFCHTHNLAFVCVWCWK